MATDIRRSRNSKQRSPRNVTATPNTNVDVLNSNSYVPLAIAGLATSVVGGFLFLRYSLARFLRFWLLRQVYEQRAETRLEDRTLKMRRITIVLDEPTRDGETELHVLTNLPAKGYPMQELYEQTYCARGDMENRIKEQFLDLKAGRMSTHYVRSNQLRMAFSAVAYLLMHHLRSRALKGTEMETATCGTIRQKLLKVGAVVKLSCRRLLVSLSAAYPFQDLWKLAASRILRFGFG